MITKNQTQGIITYEEPVEDLLEEEQFIKPVEQLKPQQADPQETVYLRHKETNQVAKFEANSRPVNIESWTNATKKEMEEFEFQQLKEEKERLIKKLYKEAKSNILLTMKIGENKYLPTVPYKIDDLISLAESKLSIITNAINSKITLQSTEFTENNEFIFRINGHKINLSQSSLIKLNVKMSNIRSDLFNQQYDLLLALNSAKNKNEVEKIKVEYEKQLEYDLTELFQ